MEGWKSGRIENGGRMEKWENRKYLVFPRVCLVGEMEKWESGKLFVWLKRKMRR